MSKKDYRVRNWRQYNHALVQRGSVTFWIDVETWYAAEIAKRQRGRKQTYSDSSILTMLVLKQVYDFTLRSCQGFVDSLFKLMGLTNTIPHYSRVCRRQSTLTLPKLPSRTVV